MKASYILTAIVALSITTFSATAQYKNNRPLSEQNHRINEGVRSGELTRAEAVNLKKQQGKLRKQAACNKANDGRISGRERAHLKRDKKKLDKKIFAQKHDKQNRF